MTDSAQLTSSAAQRRSNLLSHVRTSFAPQLAKPPITPPPTPLPPVPPPTILKDDLAVLDRVLTQIEQQSPPVSSSLPPAVAPAVPQAIQQATDTLNPAHPVSAGPAKEHLEATVIVDQQTTDTEQTVGAVPVETEVSPELSPEVESYLQKVEEQSDKIPQEIVLADDGQTISTQPHIAQPVIVLPITQEEEDQGAKKNTSFSFKWLVEWSRKLMKKFSGRVIYREE